VDTVRTPYSRGEKRDTHTHTHIHTYIHTHTREKQRQAKASKRVCMCGSGRLLPGTGGSARIRMIAGVNAISICRELAVGTLLLEARSKKQEARSKANAVNSNK